MEGLGKEWIGVHEVRFLKKKSIKNYVKKKFNICSTCNILVCENLKIINKT